MRQDNQIRLAKTVGRITYFLETLPRPAPIVASGDELEAARKRLEALEKLVDPENTADRLSSILNLVGDFMTRASEKLDLEHSGSRLRLDVRQLAVVADTLEGPIPLYRMGSGENWVGYHMYLPVSCWRRWSQFSLSTSRPVASTGAG